MPRFGIGEKKMEISISNYQHDQELKDLSADLGKFEAEYVGVGPMVKKAHDELISILDQHVRHWKQYHTSRFSLGRALFNYKALYTADRGWMVALEYIAARMGRDPSTLGGHPKAATYDHFKTGHSEGLRHTH
jgi:hypothetical protein